MQKINVEEHRIHTLGGDIYLKKWLPDNSQDKAPIFLVHDSLGSVALWKDFPLILSQYLSRCVIAYDRLGFGQSCARKDLPSMKFIEEEALVYFPLIKKALSIDQYLVLGHSVGGGMAINIASEDEACIGVITLAAQAFVEELTLLGIKKSKAFFEDETHIKRLEKWHGDKAKWVLSAWVDVWLSSEFSHWSLSECITKVKCPVLAIHGNNDEYGTIASPQFIKENVSGVSDAIIIDDCGHVPHKEKQSDTINFVLAFINQNKL